MNPIESILVVIKPDALSRGLANEIEREIKNQDMNIEKLGTIEFDPEFLLNFYGWGKFEAPEVVIPYVCFQPLPVWIVKGVMALKKLLDIKERLRHKYCAGIMQNLFHCPSSQEESKRQSNLISSKIIPYKTTTRTKNQIEAIVFKRAANEKYHFLMLKRNPERGEFWQPVTGNVEEGETFRAAAIREVREELGITNILRIVDTGFSYEFHDNDLDQFEYVLGVEISPDEEIHLSTEHTEYIWATKECAVDIYLIHDGNKEGVRQLYRTLMGG